jgi:hypothetical protein
MPLVSQAQAAYLKHNHPAVFREFARATPKGVRLPYKVHHKLVKLHPMFRKRKTGINGYKVKVDNRMRDYGDTDDGKKVIRINKRLSKSHPKHKRPITKHATKYPEVLDTMLHESLHAKNNKLTERQVYKKTATRIRQLTRQQKRKLYAKARS